MSMMIACYSHDTPGYGTAISQLSDEPPKWTTHLHLDRFDGTILVLVHDTEDAVDQDL